MGAFIGYHKIGIWANPQERDAFLDWFAEHRCQPHDNRWNYCKSDSQRWNGCTIDLNDLFSLGEIFEVTPEELSKASTKYCPTLAQLLMIISQITRCEWRHPISTKESIEWRVL